jgi:hypothetical protein
MTEYTFQKIWTEVGISVAEGGSLGRSELKAIYDNLELQKINRLLLPDKATVSGKATERRHRIFTLVEKIWGKPIEYWLNLENSWIVPPVQTKKIEDIVTPKLLYRILSTAKYVGDNWANCEYCDAAAASLNVFVNEICTKGRIMLIGNETQQLFPQLVEAGVLLDGEKYLPNPVKSLPVILLQFERSLISQDAYQQ